MYTAQKFFDNYISLGWYCGTASSMGKHGLRSYSYPFDWVSSLNVGGVIYQIESDFSDFLLKENLEQISVTTFRDTKYDMIFPHDIEISLDRDYDKIYDKYQRRIKRFRCSIEKPTCFIRAVFNNKEAEFIQNHYTNIKKVIRERNPENEIIFLLLAGSKRIDVDNCYTLCIDDWGDDWEGLRSIFDSAENFLEYCKMHLKESTYKKNLEFDRKKCKEREEAINLKKKISNIKREESNIRKAIIERFPSMLEGIIIFGTGFYGKEMTEYFQRNNIPVTAYVDNDSKKWDTMQNGIPILNPDKLRDAKGNILIAVSGHEDAIIEYLKELKNTEIRWIRLSEILSISNMDGKDRK